MSTNIIVLLILLNVALIYCVYQLLRNQQVYKIRINWIDNEDERYGNYSYSYMFNPSKLNYFGLQWPNEKNFK